MIHGDLFSGIGGFALAARWMGWRTAWTMDAVDASCDVADPNRERGRGGCLRWDARNAVAPGEVVQWWEAEPVTGHDGTTRLIPADAAARGPESPLRTLVDGFSDRLACRSGRIIQPEQAINAAETKAYAAQAVQDVWGVDGAQAVWGALGRRECVCAERVLLAFVREHKAASDSERGEATRGQATKAAMRELRCHDESGCASLGRRSLEQHAQQLADRVSQLSHDLAPYAAEAWGEYARSRADLWPVAHGVPARVAQLRGIGNAIVPQCAYEIFRMIAGTLTAAAGSTETR